VEESPKTIGDLSMVCSGFFGQARPGVICRQIVAIGKIPDDVFAAGVIKVFGKSHWKRCRNHSGLFSSNPLLEGLEYTQERGITAEIPPKRNRNIQREYEKEF